MDNSNTHLDLLPDEMLKFVLDSSHQLLLAPRLGTLLSRGCCPILTPHYVAATSRGVVPHLSHDVLQKHTDINVTYMGLEDFIERSCRDAPILKTPTQPGETALRKFTALSTQCLSILGPRRIPRVDSPAQNTNASISIKTSVGFRFLEQSDYDEATSKLCPDIAISLPDIPSSETMSKKRIEKSADRTHAWLRDTLLSIVPPFSPTFASIPPLEAEQQQLYLSDLCTEYLDSLSGVCIYDPSTSAILPNRLSNLPVLCISDPPTPHAVLHAMSQGIDLITTPFITAASEQGIALTFTFPPSPSSIPTTSSSPTKSSLGTDLFSPCHSTSLHPLSPPSQKCRCYTCTNHHAAYIHHLLQAREMLAWTLLQLHNFSVISTFFTAIRESIARGTFDEDKRRFEDFYAEDFGVVVNAHSLSTSVSTTPVDLDGNVDLSTVTTPTAVNAEIEGDTTIDHNVSSDAINDVLQASNNTMAPSKSRPTSTTKATTTTTTPTQQRGPRLRGYQMKSIGRREDKKREKIWGRFGSDPGERVPEAKPGPNGTL